MLVLRDLAADLRTDPLRTIDNLLARELVLVEPTAAERCQRAFDQLARIERNQPPLRSREGIRRGHDAPPTTRKQLRALRLILVQIARGELPTSATRELADVIARYKLVTMTRTDFERCETYRLALKRALRRRREIGIYVEAERGEPGTSRTRGVDRCADCTNPRFMETRLCRECLRREHLRRRVPQSKRKSTRRWQW